MARQPGHQLPPTALVLPSTGRTRGDGAPDRTSDRRLLMAQPDNVSEHYKDAGVNDLSSKPSSVRELRSRLELVSRNPVQATSAGQNGPGTVIAFAALGIII